MALFQPTNIHPSSLGELGNGSIDALKDLDVSWQVNGNSPMVAYQVTIQKNDAASTQIYTTGKQTLTAPFYGTNYAGETVFFHHTVPAATLAAAGIVNGGQYKLIIQQWWSATESVTTRSAAVFVTRSAPTLSLGAIPSPLTNRAYTFTAAYAQAQGDVLNWVRWILVDTDNPQEYLKDTGRIYGTAELKMDFDGFFAGKQYAVRCVIQTENGVEADTGWSVFSVAYPTADVEQSEIKACCRRLVSGVELQWPRLANIPGTARGDYEIKDGDLILPGGSSVTWDTVSGKKMEFYPWTVIWKGRKTNFDWPILFTLKLDLQGNTLKAAVMADDINVTIVIFDDAEAFKFEKTFEFQPDKKFTLAISPFGVAFQQTQSYGGLYPDPGLHPGVTLYPMADDKFRSFYWAEAFDFNRWAYKIVSITLHGQQECDFFQVLGKKMTAAEMLEIIRSGTYTPEFGPDTLFNANFDRDRGLQGGDSNLGEELRGFAVYRKDADRAAMRKIGETDPETFTMIDCGARSQQEAQYYVFGLGDGKIATAPMATAPMAPILWDWTLLRCEMDELGQYHPINIFRFGKNLVSGTIGNNNSPTLLNNFTQYPTIQPSSANYRSGTLSSAIGDILPSGEYRDTNQTRDAIYALSTAKETLFLKNRRGDLWKVRIFGPITFDTADGTREQVQTVSLPWVECGSADADTIILTPFDLLYP